MIIHIHDIYVYTLRCHQTWFAEQSPLHLAGDTMDLPLLQRIWGVLKSWTIPSNTKVASSF